MSVSGMLVVFCLFELASRPSPAAYQPPERGSVPTPRKAEAAGRSEKKVKPADYSEEPYVVESQDTRVRFENDGTGERVLSVRVRVQNEEGAQQFREIVFGYNSAKETAKVLSVTVLQPDGTSVNALASNAVKEMPLATGREEAPSSAPYKEVHVVVPSLRSGDVLEYRVATRISVPLAPGEFWLRYSFRRDAIVLDERVELNLPQSRLVSIKSPGFYEIAGRPARASTLASGPFQFTKAEENGRTLFQWKHANLTHPSGDEEPAFGKQGATPADLQLTSFQNWNRVARWVAGLGRTCSPSPEITAKAEQLVKGTTNDLEKMRALYAYVSRNIRSVNLSPDLGDPEQLPPERVLTLGYGDSLDRHRLLAAMLDVAGIHADAVLMPSSGKLDADLPSPAQFDRVITVVPENGKLVWMDSAAEVAPFGFLPASLRGKSALLVYSGGVGKLVETPVDPPFASTQHVELESKLSELGKLSGVVHYSLRGDAEFLLRTAFRRAPQAQWNQLAQTILTADGLRGEVLGVTTSDPLDTEKPFELNIRFSQPNVLDWPNKKAKIALPLVTIATPDPPRTGTQPLRLGSPLDVSTRLRLDFPPGFIVETPAGVAVSRDYAEFKSAYRLQTGTLIAQRSLNFKMRELPASRSPDYLAFIRAVEADEGQALLIENPSASLTAIPANATVDDVFDAGTAALRSGNLKAAVPLLQRATDLQPTHQQAWSDLGLAYLRLGKFDDAIAAFRKQLEVNASDEHVNDYLGLALEQQQRNDEAARAFRKQIERNPLDTMAHAALGNILLAERKYPDAVPELEKAVVLSADNAALDISLGRAYLKVSDKTKAMASFQKAIDLSRAPGVWNDVAFSLADERIELDTAQQYAESAIAATKANLQKADFARPTAQDFARVEGIGDYWDTLGWVCFGKGDFAKAKRYVSAAWRLNERGEEGDHLAQIYEKSGEKDRAIHTYALALAAANPVPETRARLILLLGGNAQMDDLVRKAQPELPRMRTFELKQAPKEDASAEFLVLMSPDGKQGLSTKIEEVRFLRGSESLRPLGESLKALDYGTMFPDASPAKLIRQGTLTCSLASGACQFALILPDDVRVSK